MRTWSAPPIPRLPGHGDAVRVYDSSRKAKVTAVTGESASMYVCGITPYDATHIGHAATFVAFDLLNRAWRDGGLTVTYASNVTDVDDPLLERANLTGVDWTDLAKSQIALFAADMQALRVIPPDVFRGAVETIPQVAEAVRAMLAAGTAYRVCLEAGAGGQAPDLGDVYADLSADPRFGDVAHLERDDMLALFAERGGDPGRDGKKHPLDPLLWRREREGEPSWDGGTLGSGRPGWHIECSVIARDGLGLPFDVQAGGADLLFPHHEMSSSHDRVLAGRDAAPRVHMHAGLVAYEGEKMSKSLGNLVLVSDLLRGGCDPMAVRVALMSHHYRSEWEWADDAVDRATARLERWRAARDRRSAAPAAGVIAAMRAALADDLDAPQALRHLDAWAEATFAGGGEAGAADEVAEAADALLGLEI